MDMGFSLNIFFSTKGKINIPRSTIIGSLKNNQIKQQLEGKFNDFMQVPNVNVQISLKYLLIQLIEFNSSSGLCHSIGFNMYVNNNSNKIKIEITDKFILIKLFISIFFILNKTMIPIKYCNIISIPTILMLIKNAVKKDRRIILLILILSPKKKLSNKVNEIYELINQKDKKGMSFGLN